MFTIGVEWGPVGTWAGAIATVLVVITTALVALGYFGGFRGPRLRLTFEAIEPWCRQGKTEGDGTALWVRVGVENLGAGPARGCLGRLINVTTNGALRPDVDPGFATDLPLDQRHVLRFSVFSDNADTVTRSLVVEAPSSGGEVKLQLT